MERSLISSIIQIIVLLFIASLLIMGFSGYLVLEGNGAWIIVVFIAVIGIVVAAMFLGLPQSVMFEGSSLIVKYIFKETTYLASEIESVNLISQRTRNGRVYFAQLVLENKKKVNISNLKPGAAVTYLVLKKWHKKQTADKLSV